VRHSVSGALRLRLRPRYAPQTNPEAEKSAVKKLHPEEQTLPKIHRHNRRQPRLRDQLGINLPSLRARIRKTKMQLKIRASRGGNKLPDAQGRYTTKSEPG
jgi:hypothetical protein